MTVAAVLRRGCAGGRDRSRVALFDAGIRAGITTGAVTGGVVGTLVVGVPSLFGSGATGAASDVVLTPVGAAYGAWAGTWLAFVPSLIGAAVVTSLVSRRHPLPASQQAVERLLVHVFRAVMVLLDAAVVAYVAATRTPIAGVAVAAPFVAVANACVAAVLCRNKTPMARAWAGGR